MSHSAIDRTTIRRVSEPSVRSRLARRLIAGLVLVSSALTLGVTALQLSLDYRRDIAATEDRFGEIQSSYLPSVVQNAWLADTERLQVSLDGIVRLADFDYAAVDDGSGLRVIAGQVPRNGLSRDYPLTVQHDGKPLSIGVLTVSAGLDVVTERLWQRGWVILLANAVQILLVALVLYLLVERLVTGRIGLLAAQSRRIGGGDLDTALELPDGGNDEIYQLGAALDEMRSNLRASRRQGEELLLERTAALEQARRVQQELAMAASVFANTQEGIVITDADAKILSVNQAFCAITGYEADEALGQTPRLLKSDYQDRDFYARMWGDLRDSGRWQGELWNRRKNGEAFRAWETITTIFDDDGKPELRIAIFSDITELRRQEERLRYQAHFDALTGLANRVLFRERLEQALTFGQRGGNPVAVLMLDLDRFKLVNDSLGHETGDRLLKQVAERIGNVAGGEATAARLGGDEFAVLVWHVVDTGQLVRLAERLLETLREPVVLDGHEIHLGASIGVSIYPQDGADASTLLKNADAAMFKVKEAGRDGVRFYDAAINDRAVERLELEAALRRAVVNNEFELFYQPKLCLGDLRVSGMEALIRWRHPERGLVPPLQFIPLAEEIGLISEIGAWAIADACRQMRAWRDDGRPLLSVAVNVSARQLKEDALADRLADCLAETGLPPGCIEVELTESILMADPAQAVRVLDELRRIGVSVAIDDFGTGYSSLNYLKRLPLSALKIDRAFVKDVVTDTRDQAIVEAIVGLSRALDLKTVAEGIETPEQLALLARLGVDYAQGFYFARPLPVAELEAWLDNHPPGVRGIADAAAV